MNGDTQVIIIEPGDSGARLDALLTARLSGISRSKIQRYIENGDVLVDNRPSKPSHRVKPGEVVELELPEPPPLQLVPEPIPINIVYEDDDIIVVDKPAGLVVHPGAGNESGTLANGLLFHFNELSGTAGTIRPGIVHRIDKETSGLLVVAKNDAAHENLSDQFQQRKVHKLYTSLVYGRVAQDRGEIEARIGRSPNNRVKMAVLKGGHGRSAHTIFEVKKRFQEFTLLDIRIRTGRTHQIRVHMAHVGHPVAGDIVYGSGREKSVKDPKIRGRLNALGRQFLHSSELGFVHPKTGEVVLFTSPLPLELKDFIDSLRPLYGRGRRFCSRFAELDSEEKVG